MGLLAGRNDLKLLEETKVGRNINRHYYSLDEVDSEVKRPVVQKLLKLMKFRNETAAFDGEFIVDPTEDGTLQITRTTGTDTAVLKADFKTCKFEILHNGNKIEI